jgi:geranylgeranyl pyrophosphate synthase
MYYQFVDDYENYLMPEDLTANDLTEGKDTMPIIHAIRIAGNKEIAGKLQCDLLVIETFVIFNIFRNDSTKTKRS